MSRKVTILGKKMIPIWLVVMLLIASGIGAAVGTIVAGKITGEINVSTGGSAGGLLIGGPFCDQIKHSVNDACEENNDDGTAENATDAWPILANQISDYSGIAFSDDVYETTAGGANTKAQQMYKFYVGDEYNISKVVVMWEGHATGSGTL